MEDYLVHDMSRVRYQEVDSMLKIIIEIFKWMDQQIFWAKN